MELCELIRKYAPGCRIKINTVVSALKKDEVMSDFIDEIAADRWKILRMKPFQYGSFSNIDIQVSNEEFVDRNKDRIGKEDVVIAETWIETAKREVVYLNAEAEDNEYAKEVIGEKLKEVKTGC